MQESANQMDYILYIGRATSILIILSLLNQDKEHSGYSLIKKIKNMSEGKLKFRAGTIYSQIDKLAEQGLIKQDSRDISTREGIIRHKSVYSLRSEGRRVLERMRLEWEDVLEIIGLIIQ